MSDDPEVSALMEAAEAEVALNPQPSNELNDAQILESVRVPQPWLITQFITWLGTRACPCPGSSGESQTLFNPSDIAAMLQLKKNAVIKANKMIKNTEKELHEQRQRLDQAVVDLKNAAGERKSLEEQAILADRIIWLKKIVHDKSDLLSAMNRTRGHLEREIESVTERMARFEMSQQLKLVINTMDDNEEVKDILEDDLQEVESAKEDPHAKEKAESRTRACQNKILAALESVAVPKKEQTRIDLMAQTFPKAPHNSLVVSTVATNDQHTCSNNAPALLDIL